MEFICARLLSRGTPSILGERMPEKTFCQLLAEAIADEEQAQKFYASLRQSLKEEFELNPTASAIIEHTIDSVEQQESSHGTLWRKIKDHVCPGK